jgi:hypothetical protein
MRRSVVLWGTSVVLVVALIAILAFRSTGSDPQLSARLLSANQVPLSWESESFQAAVKGTGCLASAMNPKGLRDSAEVNVVYINDGSVPPEVGEEVATFRNVNGAFGDIMTALQTCTKIHGDNPSSSAIFGSVSPLLLPKYGAASEAVAASITDQAVPVTLSDDVVFIRKGRYVVEVFEANLGNVDKHQFEKFITRAVAKI